MLKLGKSEKVDEVNDTEMGRLRTWKLKTDIGDSKLADVTNLMLSHYGCSKTKQLPWFTRANC